MEAVSVEQVRNSLKQCMDPEVPLSIVDMGLIYGIDISEDNELTSALISLASRLVTYLSK